MIITAESFVPVLLGIMTGGLVLFTALSLMFTRYVH